MKTFWNIIMFIVVKKVLIIKDESHINFRTECIIMTFLLGGLALITF